MAENDVTYIVDPPSIGLLLPSLLSRNYLMQGLVYLEDDVPTYCSSVVRWLDKLEIRSINRRRAEKLAWEFFHKKYPEYGEYIQLF